MKNFLLLLVFYPLFSNAQLGGDLYGLYLGTNTALNSNVGLGTVDPQTAVVNFLKAFPNTKIYAFGDHTVDPIHNQFFQVKGDSVNMYLLNFNITTGTLSNILFTVDSVGDGTPGTVTIGGNIQGLFYNCADDNVYFFHFLAPWEAYIHFAKANHTTGVVTELDSFPLGIQVIDNLVVPNHQIAYWLTYNPTTFLYDELVAYDLVNLTSSTITLSTPILNTAFWELTYNPFDGMLYGLQEDLDSFSVNNYLADLRFIKVDPDDGTVTDLTSDFLGNIIASNLAMDFSVDQLNVVIQTENPGYPQLCNYDLPSGSSLIQNLTYTNFGGVFPSLIGLDGSLVSKDCEQIATGDAATADCDDPVYAELNGKNQLINFGCHWQDYMGFDLQIFDTWGRRISNQVIDGQVAAINMQQAPSQMYFYSITDQGKLKASGKLMVVK